MHGHASEESTREANLLGTLSLAVDERVEDAVTAAAAHSGAAPAALAALSTFLDGSSIDALRRPLGLAHRRRCGWPTGWPPPDSSAASPARTPARCRSG